MRHNADLSRAGCRKIRNSGAHPLERLYLTTGEMARRLGGPAACAAPAGSRSDKKPRHAGTIIQKTFVSQLAIL
jgi:hypothetical protein